MLSEKGFFFSRVKSLLLYQVIAHPGKCCLYILTWCAGWESGKYWECTFVAKLIEIQPLETSGKKIMAFSHYKD